jgi:hypothetical protein
MVARTKPASPAARPAAESVDSPSEHIYIGSDDLSSPATDARTLRETSTLNNPIRRTGTELALYEEGFLKVTERRSGKAAEPFFLDLRFLDPVPRLERVVAARWLFAALACGATAALAAFMLRFDALYAVAAPALILVTLATAASLYVGLYFTHEKTEFCTLHGQVPVLRLIANFGSIRTHRSFVPVLSRAIEEAAERIGTDTAAFLRAEMREHYRLRGDRVLSNEGCAAGTGRILAQFDVQL